MFSTERRLGLPRGPDLSSLRVSREAQEDSYDEYSDDEAEPEPVSEQKTRKRTDQEIAEEYNQSKRPKLKGRKSLQPEQLIGVKGLSAIQGFKLRGKNMATFSRQLIQSYQQWTDDLMPGTPLEEIVWKLYTLNSKAQVKSCLQAMRNQIRNEHVERLYGLEKAEQMIAQVDLEIEEPVPEESAPEAEPTTRDAESNQPAADDTNNETIAEPVPTPTDSTSPKETSPPITLRKPGQKQALDDSSDEEELTFEDTTESNKPKPSGVRWAVVEDSDDEDSVSDKSPAKVTTGPSGDTQTSTPTDSPPDTQPAVSPQASLSPRSSDDSLGAGSPVPQESTTSDDDTNEALSPHPSETPTVLLTSTAPNTSQDMTLDTPRSTPSVAPTPVEPTPNNTKDSLTLSETPTVLATPNATWDESP